MVLPAENVTLPTRGWRIARDHALLAALTCWMGFAGVVWLVHSGQSEMLDTAGLTWWRHPLDLAPRGPAGLHEAVRDFTALGGMLLRNLFAVAAVVALLFLRLRREAILFAATVVSGWAVNSLLKSMFGRERPSLVPHVMEAGGASFPSGHSFNSACVYIAMALAFAALSPRRSVRWTVIATAMATSAFIALSRVWLGVHYPTDALAGWLGGAGWAFLASALLYASAKAAAEAGEGR